jgi:hypothetical protein
VPAAEWPVPLQVWRQRQIAYDLAASVGSAASRGPLYALARSIHAGYSREVTPPADGSRRLAAIYDGGRR